jgi:hypothetical protein
MKISRKTFVIGFVVLALVFQFISNSLLGPEVSLFPGNGEWYPGLESAVGWKRTLATLIYPVKFVLIEPLSFLGQDPDPVPPILLIAFAAYWTAMAWVLHFISTIILRKRNVA